MEVLVYHRYNGSQGATDILVYTRQFTQFNIHSEIVLERNSHNSNLQGVFNPNELFPPFQNRLI